MSTISAGTTTTTALVNSGDTTGNLVLQTNGTTTALTLDTNQNATLVGSSTATAHIPSGSSVPTNGLYLPAANTPAIASNSTKVLSVIKGSSLALEGATPQVGTGISFPATQSASTDANTLDDYEEGTWTPSQGAGLTVVGAFSSSGRYVKIGSLVYVEGVITGATSVAFGSTGVAVFAGLPFNASSTYQPQGLCGNNNSTAVAGVAISAATVYSEQTMGATANIYFSFSYRVA